MEICELLNSLASWIYFVGDYKPDYNKSSLQVPLKQTYGDDRPPALYPGMRTLVRSDKVPRIVMTCGRNRIQPKTLEDK